MMEKLDFKKWLKEHRITRSEFSIISGVSMGALRNYEESGSTAVRYGTLEKIEKTIKELDSNAGAVNAESYKPAFITPDDLWKYLPKEIIYMAQEKDGSIYGYTECPVVNKDRSGWSFLGSSGRMIKIPMLVNFDEEDWFKTLTKRPFNFWEYIGKLGLFYDDNTDSLMFGKLTAIMGDGKFQKDNSFTYSNFRPLTTNEKEQLA